MSENLIIFDPEGVNIGEYREKYPELRRIKEFQSLSDFELVWIWYFSNPTSSYVYKYPQKKDRAVMICHKLFKGDEEARTSFVDKFINRTMINQEDFDLAIGRMERMMPDARREAKDVHDQIFKDYKHLIELPIDSFRRRDEEIDYSAYLNVRKQVMKDMEDLIMKMEEGFGINKVGEMTADGQQNLEEYHKNKIAR